MQSVVHYILTRWKEEYTDNQPPPAWDKDEGQGFQNTCFRGYDPAGCLDKILSNKLPVVCVTAPCQQIDYFTPKYVF